MMTFGPWTKRSFGLLIIALTCIAPSLLNLCGFDFGSSTSPITPDKIVNNQVKPDDLFNALTGAMHHALLEWSAVSIAIVAAFVSILHYGKYKEVSVPIIGMALLCSGLVDAFHTLAATRIIQADAPNTDFIPFTWALSRIFNASIMIIGASIALIISRDTHHLLNKNKRGLYTLLFISGLFFSIAYSVVHLAANSEALPQTMFPHALITRPFDVLPLALFLFGGTLFWIWYKQNNSTIRYALLLSIIPDTATQIHMAFGSTALFDNYFNIAHSLKIIAYGSILIGLLVDTLKHCPTKEKTESLSDNKSTQDHPVDLLNIDKTSQPLALKIPFAAFLLAVSVTLAVSFGFYFDSQNLVYKQRAEELKNESKFAALILEQLYSEAYTDITFLSRNPTIYELAKRKAQSKEYNSAHNNLERIFTEMLATDPNYTQIRYIGVNDNGRELVNIVRKPNGIYSVPSSRLQQKGSAEYFRTSIKHNPGEVYFSRIELNREYGEVVLPHQPVIRVATPIFNPENDEIFGIIIINVDFAAFIQSLEKLDLSGLSIILAASEGDIIHHPNPQYCFGFDLGNRFRLQELFPELSLPSFTTNHQGRLFSALKNNQGSSHAAYIRTLRFDQFGNPRPLILLLQDTSKITETELKALRNRSLLLGISLSLIALALAVLASRRIATPLVQLTNALQHYEQTGTVENLPIKSKDEIGVFARSFHNLLLGINESLIAQEESSIRLQSTLSNATDAIISIDAKGMLLSFNTAAEEMFDHRESELIGQPVTTIMPKKYAQNHDSYLQRYSSSGEAKVVGKGIGAEVEGMRKNGEVFPIHLSIWEIDTKDGKIFTALIRDTSEQKKIEMERQEHSSLLEAILESTGDGILVLDTTGKTLRTNSRFATIWKLPESLLKQGAERHRLNYALDQLVTPQQFTNTVKLLIDNPESDFLDVLEFKDGRLIERSSKPMRISGELAGRVWSFRDISISKRAEQAMQEAKEAAEMSVRYKSEFLASMSHEIRTPMNGVLGMLGLLQRSKLGKEQQRYTTLARSSADSLLVIINDILDFSKIEAGKLNLEIFEFDLVQQLGEFSESIAHRAQEKGLELILNTTQIEYKTVLGDPSRIRQILSNLVGNAIKFTSAGEVLLQACIEENDNSTLTLTCSIKDTGIGIPNKKTKTLFDSFTQVDASTTRKYGGTGLGLSIVKSLVELMNGSISVESTEGQGSLFTFTIQLQKSDSLQTVKPDANIKETAILIVDDNKNSREALQSQLQLWGAKVNLASSGPSALEQMSTQHPIKERPIFKVVFIDMHMPNMGGLELGEQIRNNPTFNDVRLVMMTSMGDKKDPAFFTQRGFQAFFPKPTTTDDLLSALNITLNNRSIAQSSNDQTHTAAINIDEGVEIKWPSNTRILLVEDNSVNQEVAVGILQDIGLDCDIAENGVIALSTLNSAVDSMPYTAILMDCQMPEMDGYETTANIRKGSAGDQYTDIPIIAMTANAMKGDKEKCLASGMSDYTSKPIDLDQLEQKLIHHLISKQQGKSVTSQTPQEKPPTSESLIWNQKTALSRVRGKPERLLRLINTFLNDIPKRVDLLIEHIRVDNFDGALTEAHTIKGVAGNMSAERLAQTCKEIEVSCKDKTLQPLKSLALEVKQASDDLKAVLLAYRQD